MTAFELIRYGATLFIRNKVYVMLLVALFVFIWLPFNRDELEDERVHKGLKTLLLKEPLKRYGVDCSYTSKSCFQIFDVIEQNKTKRMMHLENMTGYINSAARLLVPEKFTRENSNFSTWPVDKAFVPDSYFQMMILAPFGTDVHFQFPLEAIFQALSDKIRTKQRVLVLGLGGGTIPNFLSLSPKFGLDIETTVVELDLFMAELAAKYFDFREERGRTELILVDGIAVLKQAAENKTKYKAVLLDACYSSDATGAGLLCPVSPFYKPEAIRNLYDVLEDGGTLAVNTVFNKNESGWEQSTMQMFNKSFPSCDFLPIETSKKSESKTNTSKTKIANRKKPARRPTSHVPNAEPRDDDGEQSDEEGTSTAPKTGRRTSITQLFGQTVITPMEEKLRQLAMKYRKKEEPPRSRIPVATYKSNRVTTLTQKFERQFSNEHK